MNRSPVIKIQTPLNDSDLIDLRIGDKILLSGIIYTGRDAAHKRMYDLLVEGKPLPFDISGQVIYYVGPSPAKPGQIIGSAGPTTSGRMDAYAPLLIASGLKGMIGKGLRDHTVIDAMKQYKSIYMGATGGAAALISKKIKRCEVVAYDDLGTEAIHKLEIEDMPLIVINDIYGGDLYVEGINKYQR